MNFEKINAPSLKALFVNSILERILSGELKPGDRFPSERELAQQTGISRSIVNQGMMELESQGFVSIIPRRGNFVCDYRKHPTPQTLAAIMNYGSKELEPQLFLDLMATRALLEKESAKLACKNIYQTTFEEMKEQIEILSDNPNLVVECLFKFHYCLTRASGNVVYSMIYKGFEPVLRCLIEEHYKNRQDIEVTVQLHKELLDAIESKDEEKSEKILMNILDQGVGALKESIYTKKSDK